MAKKKFRILCSMFHTLTNHVLTNSSHKVSQSGVAYLGLLDQNLIQTKDITTKSHHLIIVTSYSYNRKLNKN